MVLQQVYSKDLVDEKRVSKVSIKLSSISTITFLYEQIFRINFQESTYKKSVIPDFCQLKQSNFVASDAQRIDIKDFCLINCLLKVNDKNIYMVNEKSQFIQFELTESGNNQEYKIPYFQLKLLSKINLDDDLRPEKLAKSNLFLNQNTSIQSATLITEQKIYWYELGQIQSALFDFTNFEDQSLSKVQVYGYYVLIPDDSTGIQIYKFKSEEVNGSQRQPAQLQTYLNITISQFFGTKQEWEKIQEQIKNQQNSKGNPNIPNDGTNNKGSSSSEEDDNFEFNFSIKSFQIKETQKNSQSIDIFAYEQFSRSICVFTIDLVNKVSKLIQKITTNGKINNFILNKNFLYAQQIQQRGIRENFQLIELQQLKEQVDYLPRQTYPITSQMTKIITSDTLIYSLQENIISVIRRQVPFKFSTEDDARQQLSIQYSEGADDMWLLPVTFKTNPNTLLKKKSQEQISGQNKNTDDDTSDNTDSNYFSPFITLQDNDNILSQIEAILVKQEDSLFIRIIQEHLPHLSCNPEEEKDLKEEFELFVKIEVFDAMDANGNISLQTYTEGIGISVYREIFENSTVALVVGLSIGLTLSLIVVIVFCIYFYRMKNHYQLLLQDTTKELSREVAVSSINTSSNNSSSDSSTVPTSANQNIENTNRNHQQNQNYQQTIQNKMNGQHHQNINGNQEFFSNIPQQSNQMQQENNGDFNYGQAYFVQQNQRQNINGHQFYFTENQYQNDISKIPNNSQIQESPNPELQRVVNNNQNMSIKTHQNNQTHKKNINDKNNNTNIPENQKEIENVIYNNEQIDEEINSYNSNKSEQISIGNNSLEEQESIHNSQSDKSSRGPCAESSSSKEMVLEINRFKTSTTTNMIKQNQEQSQNNQQFTQNKKSNNQNTINQAQYIEQTI